MSRGPKHRSSKVLNIDSYHSLDFEGSQRHTCDLIEMYRVDLTPKKGILRRCVPIILPLKIELPKSDGGKVCYWSEDSNRTRDTVNFECKLTLATLGYMMVTTYDLDQIGRIKKGAGPETINPRFLTVYELTWDSATRGIKERYMDESLSGEGFGNIRLDQPQSWRHIYRAEGNYVANRFVKERLVNNELLDAVLYLGEYRPFVQVPLLLTLCRVVTDDLAERRLAEGASRESHGERGHRLHG